MNVLKRLAGTLLFIAIVHPCVLSQRSYEQGDIINSMNDSIHGFILSGTNIELSQEIRFKKQFRSGDFVLYNPWQIKEFALNEDRIFQGFTIPVYDAKTRQIVDSTRFFLHLLVDGRIELFELQTSYFKNRYFVRKDQGKLLELRKTDKLIEKDGRLYKLRTGEFTGIINALFGDCFEIVDQNIPLRKKPLARAIADYNQCAQPGVDFPFTLDKIHTSVKLSYATTLIKQTKELSKMLNASLFINKSNLYRSRKISRQYGIIFGQYHYKSSNTCRDVLYMISLIPFQISSYGINISSDVRFYYEAGVGLGFTFINRFYKRGDDCVKDKTSIGIPIPALNLSGGMRIILSKNVAFHVEIKPSLYGGLLVGGGITF